MSHGYAGQRVTVMGLGRFGGGVGVARFLAQRGAHVLVTDQLDAGQLADSVAQLDGLPNLTYRLGEHREDDFRETDLVVANPAVKPGNPYLQIARDAGVPLTTEIVLLVRELPNRLRTIGVTGSAGKSTTTAMIGHILRKAFGQTTEQPDRQAAAMSSSQPGVWVGGNLGGSLLPVVDQIRDDDWVVLELSSFMLHYLREEQWSPHIALITNISPNHLDWHGDFEEYAKSKRSLFDQQESGDFALLPSSLDWATPAGVWRVVMDYEERSRSLAAEPANGVADGLIRGRHNLVNLLAAGAAVDRALDGKGFYRWGKDFPGLPHRLSLVCKQKAEGGAVCWFNDSKSTTPEAAILGIQAFDPGTAHVILGGYDKGSDFAVMTKVAAERCAGVYTVGATGDTIADLVEAARSGEPPVVARCGTLERAVSAIKTAAQPGDAVLLSPGCASWDQFDNYEQRGERFIALVQADA